MKEFKGIFEEEKSWSIKKNISTGFVSGISGSGNTVFRSIIDSINKYLGNNAGSVIDFQLLKDAVDRHCDSVEDDISTQTPVPLYCGLAGTMAGVICGLIPLITSGALLYLLNGDVSLFGETKEAVDALVLQGMKESEAIKTIMDPKAATGINELLSGVAWAMTASILGILLTTVSSLLFKRYKLAEESGKNSFLAWMQSSLLPELPTDTSDALNKLVKNLNRFNSVFATNTGELKSTLSKVNEAYKVQGDIIQAVKDMDVMKMAKANVRVLQELQECTDELEKFGEYLTTVNGYTRIIKSFTDKYESESDRLHILEEIRDFFRRHKGEIAKTTADSDNALKTAISALKETSRSSITEFNKELVDQSEAFKSILQEEKSAFEKMAKEMKAQFCSELQQMPMMEQNLKKISEIPTALEQLITRIEKSNIALAASVTATMKNTAATALGQPVMPEKDGSLTEVQPKWMRFSILGGVLTIALACVINTGYNIYKGEQEPPTALNDTLTDETPQDSTVAKTNDSIAIMRIR